MEVSYADTEHIGPEDTFDADYGRLLEVLRCRNGDGDGQTGRVGLRCVRLVGRRRCKIVGKGWRPQGESHLCGRQNSKEKRRLRRELDLSLETASRNLLPVEPPAAPR